MADIAKAAGVSRNAVSLALRQSPEISAAMREKIAAVALKLGYERNPALGHVMSQMRRRSGPGSMGTIAVFNANQDSHAFRKHPTVPVYLRGAMQRAEGLGYALDTFWLFEEGVDSRRWLEILESRGVLGVLFIGMMRENRLPEFIVPVVERFPCVVTGVRTRAPALSFACADHHIVALRAFEKALELGYTRPGLVLDSQIDYLVERRFSAGYMSGQALIAPENRIRPFSDAVLGSVPESFRRWLTEERPDVIFTLYNTVRHWLEALAVDVPGDMGLIQLEWREGRPDWAGMNQHNDICGEVALDMLISMIHNGERGIPPFPRATLVGPTWVDGASVRHKPL
jgi:LacI family transcriptional regulator